MSYLPVLREGRKLQSRGRDGQGQGRQLLLNKLEEVCLQLGRELDAGGIAIVTSRTSPVLQHSGTVTADHGVVHGIVLQHNTDIL